MTITMMYRGGGDTGQVTKGVMENKPESLVAAFCGFGINDMQSDCGLILRVGKKQNFQMLCTAFRWEQL